MTLIISSYGSCWIGGGGLITTGDITGFPQRLEKPDKENGHEKVRRFIEMNVKIGIWFNLPIFPSYLTNLYLYVVAEIEKLTVCLESMYIGTISQKYSKC